MLGIGAGIMTLFCGMIFTSEEGQKQGFYQIALLLLFLANVIFLVRWFFLVLLSMNFKNEHILKFLRVYSIFICQKRSLRDYQIYTKNNISINIR